MNWQEEYSDLLQLVDETTTIYPHRVFNAAPERDSTPVRQVAFALENMLDQLKKPLVPNTQSLAQALVYKFNGAHRRQGYWRSYRNLVRMLRKYNEDDLVMRVSDLHKKTTASGAGFYLPSVGVLRYVGGAYLKRLFRLQQCLTMSFWIQDLCIRTVHVIMGQLELGHWEKFSVFIVALCADINNGVGTQVTSMESVYAGFSKFLRSLDDRFPASFSQLSIFSALRGLTTMKKTLDTARVMRLLQLSDEQLETVHTKDQMLRFRDEVLLNLERKKDNVDLGVAVDRAMDNTTEESVSTVDTKALTKSDLESSCGTLSPSICVDDVEDEKMNNGLQVNEGSINRLRKLKKRKKKEEKCLERSTCSVTSTSKGDNSRSEGVMEGKGRSESVGKGHGIFATAVSSRNDQLSKVMVGSEKKNKKQRSQNLISASFDSHVSFTGQKNPKKRRRISFGEITCRDSSLKKIFKKKKKRRSQDLISSSLDRLDDLPSLQSHVSFAWNSPKNPGKLKRGGFEEIACGEISSEKIVKEKKKRHSQNLISTSIDRVDDLPSLDFHVSFTGNSPKSSRKCKRGGSGEIACEGSSSKKIMKKKKKGWNTSLSNR